MKNDLKHNSLFRYLITRQLTNSLIPRTFDEQNKQLSYGY